MKMNKLIGLAFTYCDSASSEAEFLTAGRIGKKMIMKELNCPLWVASRILEILAGKESWLPIAERMHLHGTLPTNANDMLAKALKDLGIRYSVVDYGFGGFTYKEVK
jgi:hypothetical protein